MKKKKIENYPLLNTSVCQFTYEEYLKWCEDMDIEPAKDESNEFWQWCYDEAEANYESDIDRLASSILKDRWFLIVGKLGLWWGHPKIKPILVKGIVPALEKCFGDCDDMDAELDVKEGVINVQSHHHDGTNFLSLLLLNKNGLKWAENADDKGEEIKYNNRWWTKIKSINDLWEN